MKKRAFNSTLQNQILLYMERAEIVSLTELANKLNVQRSSVSRAIHALLDLGLVSHVDKNWDLTEEGKNEIFNLRQQISEHATKTTKTASRLIEQSEIAALTLKQTSSSDSGISAISLRKEWVLDASIFDSAQKLASMMTKLDTFALAQSVIDSQSKIFTRFMPTFSQTGLDLLSSTALIDVGKLSPTFSQTGLDLIKSSALTPSLTEMIAHRAWSIVDDYNQPAIRDLCSHLSVEAISSFAQSQRLSAMSMGQVSLFGRDMSPVLNDLNMANVGLSHMIRDLGDIRMRGLTIDAPMPMLAIQMPDVAAVARTFKGYLADAIGSLDIGKGYISRSFDISLPTATTLAYVDSVSISLLPSVKAEEKPSNKHPDFGHPNQFDNVFANLGPNFITMWHGSWAVLRSDSPDRIRQAAHSGRELLMQVLAYLAPDTVFSEVEIQQFGHDGKVTRKMRVKRILLGSSSSKVSWAESMAKVLDETYAQLSAVSHDREFYPNTTEQQLTGLLHSLGGFLTYIEGFCRR